MQNSITADNVYVEGNSAALNPNNYIQGGKTIQTTTSSITTLPSITNVQPVGYTTLQIPTGGMQGCLLYTSPSPRDRTRSRMPSSA